jgi:hypothetical protein
VAPLRPGECGNSGHRNLRGNRCLLPVLRPVQPFPPHRIVTMGVWSFVAALAVPFVVGLAVGAVQLPLRPQPPR